MSRSVTIYYGMSGTFKRTTIQSRVDNFGIGQYYPLWSMIKPWKYYESHLFPSKLGSDLDFALLHLVRLASEVSENTRTSEILSERGVTDMLFYYGRAERAMGCPGLSDAEIARVVHEEEIIIEQNSYIQPRKILMIQSDTEFIRDTILTEPTRAAWFTDVDSYLEAQNEYVEFTKRYNNIGQVINIKDAKRYIEDLGLDFRP